MMSAVTIAGEQVPTYNVGTLTGWDWIAWRLAPCVGLRKTGLKYVFRRAAAGLGWDNQRLSEHPFAVRLPFGEVYQVLNTAGDYKLPNDKNR